MTTVAQDHRKHKFIGIGAVVLRFPDAW